MTAGTGLMKALLAFQQDAPALQRDAINPHFGSKFVSLESLVAATVPVANKHGLVVSQFPTVIEGQPGLRTLIIHAESGEYLEDAMLLMAAKDDPQGQGSAITYARRYALMAALGLVADEDDDGQLAVRRTPGAAPPTDGRENPSPVSSEAKAAPEASPAQLAHIKALISDCAKLRKTTQKAVTDALVNDGYSLTGLSDAKAGELVTKLETWAKNLAKA